MLPNERISSPQFVMLATVSVFGSAILYVPSTIARHAGQDAWLSLSLAALGGAFVAWLTCRLAGLYPGRTLFEIPGLILGRHAGKAIAILYVWWTLHITAEVVREFASFIMTAFMPETPLVVFVLIITAVAAYAVDGGLEVMGRMAGHVVPIILGSSVILFLLALPEMRTAHLMPPFDTDALSIIKGAAAPFSWFGELVTFAAVIPFLSRREAGLRSLLYSVGLIYAFLMQATAGVIAILGPQLAGAYFFPVLMGARMIRLSTFIERVEPFLMFVLIVGGILKIMFFYWAAVYGTAQVAGLRDYRPIVVPAGAAIASLAILAHASMLGLVRFVGTVWPFYAQIFEVGIPLFLLLAASRRKTRRQNAATAILAGAAAPAEAPATGADNAP